MYIPKDPHFCQFQNVGTKHFISFIILLSFYCLQVYIFQLVQTTETLNIRKYLLALAVSRTDQWMVHIQEILQISQTIIILNNCISQEFATNIVRRSSRTDTRRTDGHHDGHQQRIFLWKLHYKGTFFSEILLNFRTFCETYLFLFQNTFNFSNYH